MTSRASATDPRAAPPIPICTAGVGLRHRDANWIGAYPIVWTIVKSICMLLIMPVTIRQVADAAGVSPSTVSHALSGNRSVSARTSERIFRVIEELGYRPNQLAASMRAGRTMAIGAIVPDIANPYFGQMIAALERTAGPAGYSVMVGSSELDAQLEARHVRSLLDRQVDMIVYLGGTDVANPALIEAAGKGCPVVAVDEAFDWLPDSASTVTVDNEVGGTLAAQHLLGLGHERLAVLGGSAGLPTARLRRQGFVNAAHRAGVDAQCVTAETYTIEAGREAGGALLARCPDVTGVFCANDLLALGLIQVATETGHRVPDDLSVVGFDDTFLARLVTPALTTIRQPVHRIGQCAAELAITAAREESSADQNPVLPVDLVVRRSTEPRRSKSL